MKKSEKFMKDISKYLDSVGDRDVDSIYDNAWNVNTKGGLLIVHPRDTMIFARFDDPEKANELKVYSNPHSGKWNFYGNDALDSFKSMLDKILHDGVDESIDEEVDLEKAKDEMLDKYSDNKEWVNKFKSEWVDADDKKKSAMLKEFPKLIKYAKGKISEDVNKMVSESTRYMFEEESDSMEYYIKWSSVFDDPDAEYDINLFSDVLKKAGATVWTDNQYGWSNQPEVVMFKDLSKDDAEGALGELPVFKGKSVLIGEVDVDWDDTDEEHNDEIDEGMETVKVYDREYKAKSFKSDDEANAFLEKNPKWGVIKVDDDAGIVYVANNDDKGKPVSESTIDKMVFAGNWYLT